MNTIDDDTVSTPKIQDAEVDVLALYLRDVAVNDRLSQDEELHVAREITEGRKDIVDLLRGLVLEASVALGIDAEATARLRDEMADPQSERRVTGLQQKLDTVAAIVRREMQALRAATRSPILAAKARRLLDEIKKSFGVSPEVIERIATTVAEKRQRIHDAKQRLIEGNLRLVVYLARRMKWRGVDIADLIQEGNIALMRAADSFDPARGCSFGSFACTAIRRAMSRFGSATSQPVHVPAEVRARRRRVKQAARYLGDKNGYPASWEEIAAYLEVSKSVVVDALGVGEEPIPLDVPYDDGGQSVIERLADPTAGAGEEAFEGMEEHQRVCQTVRHLDERDRTVIESRFGLGNGQAVTLAEIGQTLGVTRERARQLEGRALRSLRERGAASDRRRARPRRSRAATVSGRPS